jgi:twinkle protein
VTSASVVPIELGEDLAQRCERLYERGLPPGDSTGWKGVDAHFTVAPQQWTLITGTPGSGKSEWLDALAVNLAENHDWDFAFYSPENYPTETHLAKLAEKRVRKPFGKGPTDRMTMEEFREASVWILDHFVWLKPAYNDHLSLLQAAQQFMRRPKRKFAVALDPWNTLEHLRPRELSETEYVGQVLTSVTNWCREKYCHIFIVAHPAKLQRDSSGKRPVPTPYDVSGSAHWYNKADNVITVHRDQVDGGQDVELHIQKVRFKHIGRVGVASLKYDRITGRYFELSGAPIFDVTAGKPEQYRDPQSVIAELEDVPWEDGRE